MSRKKSIIIFLIFSIYLISGLRAVSESPQPVYNVSGYVTDNSGFGLGSVLVRAVSSEDISSENTTETDASGFYLIEGLSNRTYNFSYSRAGFDTGYLEVVISGEDRRDMNITILDTTPPASVFGIQINAGKFFINNSWINPADTDFSYVWFRYENGSSLANAYAPVNYLYLDREPHYTQNISAQTVDTAGNINPAKVWFNASIPNSPIIITNTSDWAGVEGRTVYLDFDYIDDDHDTGTFQTDAGNGTLDSSTGVFIWHNALAGMYRWEFNVSDGYGSTSSFQAIVAVNESLSMTSYAPAGAAITDHAGTTRVFEAAFNQAADVNWYVNGSLVKTDPGTASSSYTNTSSEEGIRDVTVSASNANGSVSRTWTWVVNDYTPGTPADIRNGTYNFGVNWTWEKGIHSDFTEVLVNGTLKENSQDNFYNFTEGMPHGTYSVQLREYNSTQGAYGGWANQTTSIPNNPPVQEQVGNREVYKGQELTFSISTADADSDTITYGTNATKGDLNTTTGMYTWVPGDGDAGEYIWEFNSSDGYGGIASETIAVTVKNPLDIDLRFIEPYIINDSGIWNEAWRNASTGHLNKYIGIDHIFRNTGNTSLIITNITRIYNNASREPEELYPEPQDKPPMMLTLAENESKSCPDIENKPITLCRIGFEIDPGEVRNGVFNLTLQLSVRGYNGTNGVFYYTNSTSISLPMVPIYRVKRADADIIPVNEGKTTTVVYTLEANSSVNLTDVRITDDLYTLISGNESYSIKELEANRSQQISYRYPVNTGVLSGYRCEGGIQCVINLANFTAYDPVNGVFYNDTDYVEVCVNCIPVTGSDTVRSSPGGDSSGGGGGGIPPGEDWKNIERREVKEMDILAKVANVYVFRSVEPVMVVTFESSVSEYDVPVAVEVLRNRSKSIKADAPGKPYKYFNVFAGRSGFSSKVSNGVVVVQVNNSWLEENSFDPESVSLYKWQGEWVKKETEIAEKKSNYTYYASLVGNFSSFAIAWDKEHVEAYVPDIPAPRSENAKNTTDSLASLPDTGVPGKRNILPAAVMLLFGLVGIIIYLKSKHSK
ncbi:MAG: PGF-pre-PGF domain-containing protein [Candidatus Methanoperedens sp.]|nr:PGF-pre-PGF domain-containing protein [Candidatus Methanoperedens sp.]